MTLLDTGDFYGAGHNEMLIGRALKDRRHQALLSVKFGALRSPDGGWGGFDTRPAAVKNFAAYSLKRLGVDHIDIYRPSRLDPNVPIEDTAELSAISSAPVMCGTWACRKWERTPSAGRIPFNRSATFRSSTR